MDNLALAHKVASHGCLLLEGKVVGVGLATGVDLGAVGIQTEISGDGGKLVQARCADTGLVAEHVIGILAGLGVGVIDVGTEAVSVQVHILHVLRTESVLYIDTIKRGVTTLDLGIEGIGAHRPAGQIATIPHGADHEIGVLEPIGLDLVGPPDVNLTCAKRTLKTD